MSAPLKFKSISVRNFLSYGNQETVFYLDNQGTVTITGENRDTSGSNGSGKCVYPETRINIRVKGVEQNISIGELYELARKVETHEGRDNFSSPQQV